MDTTGFGANSLQLVCDVTLKPKSYFLALLDRSYPPEYLYSMKQSADGGYEIFHAIAEVGERLSLMCQRNECGLVIMYSDGGSFSTVTVEIFRPTSGAGAVTLKAGSVLSTSVGMRQFVTTTDVVFGPSDVGPHQVLCQAIARGYEYNVRGQRTSKGQETLPGEIDIVEYPLQEPVYGDPTISVRQIQDAVGGTAAWLDGHGYDRGIFRDDNEPDDLYRIRVRTIPDTGTPGSIRRAAKDILEGAGIDWQFVETFDIGYQTCWDAPSSNPGTPTYQAIAPLHPRYDEDTFVYDDPRPPKPFKNRWLDDSELRGAFIVVVDVPMPPSPDQAAAIAAMYRKIQQIRLAGVVAIMDHFHSW